MYKFAIGLLFYLATASATPQIYFPVNAQVPPVARVAQPFQYQFSAKTCVSSVGTSLTYTLEDAPSWLSLDSARTLSGTPSSNDLGPVDLKLVATDSTGSLAMPITLIVVDNVAPAVQTNITSQLSQAGSLVDSNSVELRAGAAISLAFSTGTFSNASALYYYATSADRSPLPSWLVFTTTTISFSGTAPLTDLPQEFGILLSASSIAGFAETSVEFNLVISNHILAFDPLEQLVQVNSPGASLTVSVAQQLLLDGKPITAQQLSSISANVPSSIKFDNKTLTLSGTLPSGNQDQIVTFNATDIYGDTASGSVRLAHQSVVFAGSIGTLSAVIGQDFSYKIPSTLFKSSTVNVANVSLGSAASWLQYDASSMTVHGKVPESASASTITATLTASSGTATETQSFTIRLVSASASQSSATSTGSSGSASKSASATPSGVLAGQATSQHKTSGLTKGDIAAAVVFPVLFLLALLIALLYCVKKRAYYPVTNRSREKAYPSSDHNSPKRGFLAVLGGGASKSADGHRDLEKSTAVYQENVSHKSSSSQTLPARGMSHVVGAQEYSDDSTLAAHEEHVLASIDRTSLGPSAGSSPRRGPNLTTILPAIVSHPANTSPSQTSAKRKSLHSMQESSQRPLKRLSINRFSRGESNNSLQGSPRKTHRAKQSSWVLADKPAHRPQESVSEVTYNSNRLSGNASYRVSALTSNSNPFRASTRLTSDAARRSIRLVPVDEQFSERRQNYFRHRRRTTSSQHSPWFTGSIDNRESMVSRRMTPYGSRYGGGSRTRGRSSIQSVRSIQSRSSDALGPSFAESPIAERSNDDWEDSNASDASDKENDNVISIVPDSIRQSRRAKWSKRLQRDGSGQVESWRTTSMQSRVSSSSGKPPSQRKHSALSVVLNDASWYSKLSAEERRQRQEDDASSGIMAFI